MEAFIGKELGRGGFGIVYEKKDNPSIAIKVSDKTIINSCRTWSNEYNKIKEIIQHIENHKSYKKLEKVQLLDPLKFSETSSVCYMLLPRVYRPQEKRSKSSKSSDIPYYTVHALFGETSLQKKYLGRGEFIGLREIAGYVSKEDIKKMVEELGIMLALIHYIAKNDACDIEVFLGRDATSKKLKLFIGDFDKVSNIETFTQHTIDNLVWCMEAVEYFPKKEVDEELYTLFKEGYLSITGAENEYARQLFAKYESS
jgi:hypothetical protein